MEKNLISYGQHYLEDKKILDLLVLSANLEKTDIVLEVGAGDGRITAQLAKKVQKVISYEIDTGTQHELEILSKKFDNIEFVYRNFLQAKNLQHFNKIVSSLPYQITEPFIEKIKNLSIDTATLIVGKTFAKNVYINNPQSKLALLTNCFFYAEYVSDVDKKAFSPPPKTESAIIILKPKDKSSLLEVPELFLMRELFEQRDKKLKNAINESLIKFYKEKGIFLSKNQSKKITENYVKNLQNEDIYLEQMNNTQVNELYNFLKQIIKKVKIIRNKQRRQ